MGGLFDIDSKENKVKELENELNNPSIWDNQEYAKELTTSISSLKSDLEEYKNLKESIEEEIDLVSIMDEDEKASYIDELKNNIINLEEKLKEFEIKSLLNGEYDNENCYLEIHPGAGGTEAQDWANMLLRMYMMFASKFGFNAEILDQQNGEEAGIKSVMVRITGNYAYGYLKGEIGIHRLVRISPFNAAGKRQTSFAAVNITPEITASKDIEIKDDEIRIDVFRSSGCGGQGVNTTDSAVRITHFPSGIVVSVQNERSQLKNKEIAMNILKSKLKKISDEKQKDEINSLKGNENIDFGSQIRNYVLEPYSLVKDLRSEYESSNPGKVLDGDLYPFIEAYLRMKR